MKEYWWIQTIIWCYIAFIGWLLTYNVHGYVIFTSHQYTVSRFLIFHLYSPDTTSTGSPGRVECNQTRGWTWYEHTLCLLSFKCMWRGECQMVLLASLFLRTLSLSPLKIYSIVIVCWCDVPSKYNYRTMYGCHQV